MADSNRTLNPPLGNNGSLQPDMSSPQTVSNPERLSLSEHAYILIRDRILKGVIPLGASLSRRKLASELGMSLLPVAEALQRLENEELIESRPRVGTRVCLPGAEGIRERYVIREALESQAARLFAERASARDRLELQKMADHMDALFNRCPGCTGDREFLYAVHSYHLDFHLRIAECTGCLALRRTIEKNHVLIFNWLFEVAAHRPALPPRFHRDLADIISSDSPENADRAMRLHIRHGLDNVVSGITPQVRSGMPRQKTRIPRSK
jgi:GntR family transcriptional regulator, rspAB operon transcriptional repressor